MKPPAELRTEKESRLWVLLAKFSEEDLELLASSMSLASTSTLSVVIQAVLQERKNLKPAECTCGRKWTSHPSSFWSAAQSPCPVCFLVYRRVVAVELASGRMDMNSFLSGIPASSSGSVDPSVMKYVLSGRTSSDDSET